MTTMEADKNLEKRMILTQLLENIFREVKLEMYKNLRAKYDGESRQSFSFWHT